MSGNPLAARSFRAAGLLAVAAASVLAMAVLCGAWLQGWRWFDVATPSMGTAAPVGSLVVTEPTRAADLKVGEIIVFSNPAGKRYSHRVVGVEPAVSTKGDLNGAVDPWPVTDANLVGRAATVVVNGGFVLRGVPWLVGGLLLVQLLVLVVQPRWRSYARFLLTILVLDLVLIVVHPLVGVEAITYRDAPDGVEAYVVSTGIVPVSVAGQGGDRIVLAQGEAGSVVSQLVDGKARFFPALDLSWPWWLFALLVILAPLVWSLTVGFRVPLEEPMDESGSAAAGGQATPLDSSGAAVPTAPVVLSGAVGAISELATVVPLESEVTSLEDLLEAAPEVSKPGRWHVSSWVLRGSAALLALVLIGMLAVPSDAYGAFTAKVKAPQDTVGSRQFFTCLDAIWAFNAHPKGVLWVGYALGGGVGTAAAADQSGRGYNVTAVGISGSTSRGCLSDAVVRSQNSWLLAGSATSGIRGNTSSLIAPDPGAANDSDAMTWTLWFRTTSTSGGVLTCSATAALVCGDRTTWLTNSGRLAFQVGTTQLLTSQSWNSGAWHFMVAQLSRTSGMKLWVDGDLVAADAGTTAGTALVQQPQWGFSNSPIPFANAPTNAHLAGNVQMGAMIAETPSGGRIGDAEVLAMYQAAQL